MTVTAANDIGSLYNVSSDAVKNILAGSSDTTQGDNELSLIHISEPTRH